MDNAIQTLNSRFDIISRLLLDELRERFDDPNVLLEDLEFSDNFAEVLEKFFVLHVRIWRLEDLAGQTKDDVELANLKRKIDFCFKVKRPQLIRTINLMLDEHISKQKQFQEEDVKCYSGYNKS